MSGCLALTAGPAHAAVPPYQSFEVAGPPPQTSAAFGERLRALGDLNGDGARDVLMASPSYDSSDTVKDTGRVYLYNGRTRELLRTLDPPTPQAGAKFGFWDANLGDVDGDGVSDFVVSANSQTVGGAKVGEVYIFSGRSGTLLRTIDPPEALGATGPFGGDFGGNIIGPGDLSGDGVGDFVATSSGAFAGGGAAYAFNGKTGALLYKVENPAVAQAGGANFGFGAAELGDVNGDGTNDYQIGAPKFDEGAVVDVGRCYVINGRTGAVLLTLQNPEPEANARFGQADADGISLGDVDGGGPDVFVDTFLGTANPVASPPLANAGKAFVFNGRDGHLIRRLDDPNPATGRGFAASNASAGDINGDGQADLLVSARGGTGGTSVGAATVFGGPSLTTVLATFRAPTEQGAALFSTGLASPGDVNGDGFPDYYMSARLQDVNGVVDAGAAYAFFSQAPIPGPPPPPPPADVPVATKPTVTPTVARVRPTLSVSARPGRDRRAPYRFTISGTLKPPSGLSRATACTAGKVRVTVKRTGRSKTLSSRLVKLSSKCRFTVTVTFKNRSRLGKGSHGTLRFTARYQGNARLLATQVTRTARYG